MSSKWTFRSKVNQIGWLAVLFAVVGAVIALRYLTGLPGTQWWQYLYVFSAAAGVFFIGNFFLQLLLVLPLSRFSSKVGHVVVFVLTFVLLVALVSDTFVYQQYRFHINWAMIDLALVGGREVFSFSTGMMIKIAFLVVCLAVVSLILIWVSKKVTTKAVWPCVGILVGYLVVNAVSAYSVSQNVKSVTVLAERIPLYYPIRANTFLSKFGFVAVREEKLSLSQKVGSFHYPLNALTLGKGTDLNVLILAIDSLRADILDAKTMPNLTKLQNQALVFQEHYSAGNATRAGVFSLFYGLPPFYWQSALSTNVPSSLVTGFQKAGYEITAFATATLLKPEFYATVFSSVSPLRMGSDTGETTAERDRDSVDDFEKWLEQRDTNKKFMSFMFLDSVHSLDFPEDLDVPYDDYWQEVDRLKLSPDFDPREYFNRYKNAAYWQDVLIGRVLQILEKNDRLKDTIVIVTSDHGEEFNDSKLNYWGHNGNFSDAQIKIPLVIAWPEMPAQQITHRTTAYDVGATLLKRVLAVQNPIEDFSVGKNLFDPKGREVFFVDSYNEDAIVAGDEVLLVKMSGALEGHNLKDWKEIDAAPLKKWGPAYLQMRGKYPQ